MKITIEIRSEGGPIDTTVEFAKRASHKVLETITVLRKHIVKALAVPPPVLPKPSPKADEIAAG